MKKRNVSCISLLILCAMVCPLKGFAEEVYAIVIKNHVFTPSLLEVPAGKKVKLMVDNQDNSAEEFESHDLNREKVIPAKGKGIIFVGPLRSGEYKFFGEFHQDTAQGILRAVTTTPKTEKE